MARNLKADVTIVEIPKGITGRFAIIKITRG